MGIISYRRASLASGISAVRGALLATLLGLVPAALAQPVLITASQTINPGQATITPTAGGSPVPLATADITVSGTTLTINGRHTIRDLVVQNNGTITHTAGFTFDYSGGAGTDVVNGLWLNVVANPTGGNFTIATGGVMDVSARGHAPGTGTGAGLWNGNGSCGSSGAGHGGNGGISGCQSGGAVYGSITQPTTMGSGSGRYGNGNSPLGSGGGVVRLTVGGVLAVNGAIISNGGFVALQGGGAGGSIWIEAGTIEGAGLITANGGDAGANNTNWGSGAGGRIAIYAGAMTLPMGNIRAWAGGAGNLGGVGTVYTKLASETLGDLRVIHNGSRAGETPLSNTADFGEIIVGAGGVLTPTMVNARAVTVNAGGVVTHPQGQALGVQMNISDNFTIATGGVIDVSARGHAPGTGTGAGLWNGDGNCGSSGAGHGGNGGISGCQSGGAVYGSITQPTTMGSGSGRYGNGNSPLGSGGGVVRLTVGGVLAVNGAIISNGGFVALQGGGAGGSIWIEAGTIEGAGLITANGGDAGANNTNWGSGAGGRIALYSCNVLTPLSNIRVESGLNGNRGQPGTVLIDTVAGNVAAVASAFCTGELATLSVQAGGVGTITYQWRRNGVDIVNGVQPSGAVFAGATTASLTITDITQDEAGSYNVLVTASCASIVSNAVPVDVVGASPFPCDNIDFNNDCSAFDPLDIEAFFSVFSEGGCIPANATCNDIDFNNDGSLFDPIDIDAFLSVFSEGPCI